MIDNTERLIHHLESARVQSDPPLCALDTEADSLHRYRESLCLIQFSAAGNEPVLIDPLTIDDLSPLGGYLSTATVWMHGADYDMTMLKRQFGELPPVVHDTQIGARLLGARRFGLGDLVQEYFGVELSKSSQKADWGKRPLSKKMIEYAVNDVRYLLEMGDIITTRLQKLGRYDWFVESCEAARLRVLERDDNEDDLWRVQGCGKLDRFGLLCLRTLWHWRDGEAKAWDRPPFMVANNRQLLEWSSEMSAGRNITLPRHFRPDRVKRFRAAVASIEAVPESDWPERIVAKRRKRSREFERRLEALLKDRDRAAAKLDIDGSLIAPRAALETIAAEEAAPEDLLLRWQLERLGIA
jgi:ribonuclease D